MPRYRGMLFYVMRTMRNHCTGSLMFISAYDDSREALLTTLGILNYSAWTTSHWCVTVKASTRAAEEIHRQALQLSEKVLAPEHPDTPTNMSSLCSRITEVTKSNQLEIFTFSRTPKSVCRIILQTPRGKPLFHRLQERIVICYKKYYKNL
jgi:hypothetical protein